MCFSAEIIERDRCFGCQKINKDSFDLRTVAVALGIGPDELEGFRQSLENKTGKGRENGSEIELLFAVLVFLSRNFGLGKHVL